MWSQESTIVKVELDKTKTVFSPPYLSVVSLDTFLRPVSVKSHCVQGAVLGAGSQRCKMQSLPSRGSVEINIQVISSTTG